MDATQSRATIEDVAARAGVSISTVSRVVNGRYGVAPATLDRVRAAVVDLGFESSLIARSLRSGRTNVIGVLVADIEPFSAEVLKGIAHALRESSYELIVYSGGHRHEDGWERRYLSRLAGTLTDGAILVTPTVVEVASSKPVVAVDPHVGGSRMPTIDAENFEGAIAATRHLVELGHRRIGFIGGRPDLESARRREQGYRVALEAAGIPVDPDLVASATSPRRRPRDRPTSSCRSLRGRPRSSPPTTSRRSRRFAPPSVSASPSPTTSRSSASTTSRSRRSRTRR